MIAPAMRRPLHGGYPTRRPRPEPGMTVSEFLTFADAAPQEVESYGSLHAFALDLTLAPPESYDDPWLDRIFAVRDYLIDAPCTCTNEQAAEPWDACPRCTLLNVSNAGR